MVQMDRFVHTLNGSNVESIMRKSSESAATMKEKIATIKRLLHDIRNHEETSTWCGYPHNLLLPRLYFNGQFNIELIFQQIKRI